MANEFYFQETIEPERLEAGRAAGRRRSGVSRREFVQLLGAGLLLTRDRRASPWRSAAAAGDSAAAVRRTSRPGIHLGNDGTITVMAGKVELGQGARAELTQAAAEELRVAADQIQLIMADTALVPNDGVTAGSGTTPRTVPADPQGRRGRPRTAGRPGVQALAGGARRGGGGGRRHHPRGDQADHVLRRPGPGGRHCQDIRPGDSGRRRADAGQPVEGDGHVAAAAESPRHRHRGASLSFRHRAAGHALRKGAASAELRRNARRRSIWPRQRRWRAWSWCATGRSSAALRRRRFQAEQAVAAIAEDGHLADRAAPFEQGVVRVSERARPVGPRRRQGSARGAAEGSPERGDRPAPRTVLSQSYEVAYIQHAPMETRAGVAEWNDGKLTVWTGTANPFGVRGELARALRVARGSGAGDRARSGLRVRRQTPGRGGRRGGAAGPGGRPARVRALDAGRGVHLGLLPARRADRDARRIGRRAARSSPGSRPTSIPAARPSIRLTTFPRRPADPWAANRRCVRAPTAPWRPRPTTSRGSRSWTSWPMPPGPIRWRSGWPI